MTYRHFIRKYGMVDSKAAYREYLERVERPALFLNLGERGKQQYVEQTFRLRFIESAWQ